MLTGAHVLVSRVLSSTSLCVVVSVLCASLGLVFPSAWPLVVIGLSLFFLSTINAHGVWSAGLVGAIFGVATGAAGTVWFLNVLPLDFLGILTPSVQVIAVVMTWLYVSISLGMPIALISALLWWMRKSVLFPFFAMFFWSLGEVGRMWCFAVTTWAPQSLLGPHFSAASIGYPLAENNYLLQLSRPFGVNALNAFVALIAGVAAQGIAQREWRHAGRHLSIVGVLLLLPLGESFFTKESRASGEKLRFAIIAENLDEVRDFDTHVSVAERLTEVSEAIPPVDVILLPEEFSLTSIFWSRSEAEAFMKRHFGDREVLILNTRNDLFPAEEDNRQAEPKKLVYESTTAGEQARYVKLNLMPLGEYAPAFTRTFFSLINDRQLHEYIDSVRAYAPPGTTTQAADYRGVRIGGLLCSDILSPWLYRSLATDGGAQVLVNLANQFWFHGSRALYWKTLQMAKVHAAQNRLPLMLANNLAPSFALDKWGRVIAESEWGKRTVLFLDAP